MEYPIDKREYMLARLAYCRLHPIKGLYPKLVIVQPHDRRMFLVNPNRPTYRKHRPGSSHPRCVNVSPHYAIRWCKSPPAEPLPAGPFPDPLQPHIETFSDDENDGDLQMSSAPSSPKSRENAPSDDVAAAAATTTSSSHSPPIPRTLQDFDDAISRAAAIARRLRTERLENAPSDDVTQPPTINTEGRETPAAGGPSVTFNIPPVLPDKDVPSDSPPIPMPPINIRPARPNEKPFNFENEIRRIHPKNLELVPPRYLSSGLEFIDNLPLFPDYFNSDKSLDEIYAYVSFFRIEYENYLSKYSDLKRRSEYPNDWKFYARVTRAYSLLSRCYIYFFTRHGVTPKEKIFSDLKYRYQYTSVRQAIFKRQYGEARNAYYTGLYDILVELIHKYPFE